MLCHSCFKYMIRVVYATIYFWLILCAVEFQGNVSYREFTLRSLHLLRNSIRTVILSLPNYISLYCIQLKLYYIIGWSHSTMISFCNKLHILVLRGFGFMEWYDKNFICICVTLPQRTDTKFPVYEDINISALTNKNCNDTCYSIKYA